MNSNKITWLLGVSVVAAVSSGCGRSSSNPSVSTNAARTDNSPVAVLKGQWGYGYRSDDLWRDSLSCAPRRGALILGASRGNEIQDVILRAHPEWMERVCSSSGASERAIEEDRIEYRGQTSLFFVLNEVIYGGLHYSMNGDIESTQSNNLLLAGVPAQTANPVMRVLKSSETDSQMCKNGTLSVLVPRTRRDNNRSESTRWMQDSLTISQSVCAWLNETASAVGMGAESEECRAYGSLEEQKCFKLHIAPVFGVSDLASPSGLVLDVSGRDLNFAYLDAAKEKLGPHLTAAVMDRSTWTADRSAPSALVAAVEDRAMRLSGILLSTRAAFDADFIVSRPEGATLDCSPGTTRVHVGHRWISVHADLASRICQPGVYASAATWTIRSVGGEAFLTGYHAGAHWIIQGVDASPQARASTQAAYALSDGPRRSTTQPETICHASSRIQVLFDHWHLPLNGAHPTVQESSVLCNWVGQYISSIGRATRYDVLREMGSNYEMIGFISLFSGVESHWARRLETETGLHATGLIAWDSARIQAARTGVQ